jgi:hypothetical protein
MVSTIYELAATCTNAAFAVKQIYLRNLKPLEDFERTGECPVQIYMPPQSSEKERRKSSLYGPRMAEESDTDDETGERKRQKLSIAQTGQIPMPMPMIPGMGSIAGTSTPQMDPSLIRPHAPPPMLTYMPPLPSASSSAPTAVVEAKIASLPQDSQRPLHPFMTPASAAASAAKNRQHWKGLLKTEGEEEEEEGRKKSRSKKPGEAMRRS